MDGALSRTHAAPAATPRWRDAALAVPAHLRVLALGLAGIAMFGTLQVALANGAPFGFANLDTENSLPALWSGLLLLVAAASAVQLRRTRARGVSILAASFLVLLFAFMGVDEVVGIHERIDGVASVDWQIWYAPLVLVGGWAWCRALLAMWRLRAGAVAFAMGAVAWVLAQTLEMFEYGGTFRPGYIDAAHLSSAELERINSSLTYYLLMIPEELLEMTGSLLFAVGLLAGAAAVRRRRVQDAVPEMDVELAEIHRVLVANRPMSLSR